jgi:hypothetical protein
MSGGGWWRRNWWGLLVLVPALALAIVRQLPDAYDMYWKTQPREPVSAAAGQWVSFAGARMRLVELAEATDVVDFDRHPFTVGHGVRIWRARIAFDTQNPEAIGGCRIEAEDGTGRTFGANPSELSRAHVPYAGCSPDTDKAPGPAFEIVAYFVLPPGDRPVAVRITLLTRLPRYAHLTPAAG